MTQLARRDWDQAHALASHGQKACRTLRQTLAAHNASPDLLRALATAQGAFEDAWLIFESNAEQFFAEHWDTES